MRHSSQRSSLIITEQRRMNMGKLTFPLNVTICRLVEVYNSYIKDQRHSKLLVFPHNDLLLILF